MSALGSGIGVFPIELEIGGHFSPKLVQPGENGFRGGQPNGQAVAPLRDLHDYLLLDIYFTDVYHSCELGSIRELKLHYSSVRNKEIALVKVVS